MSDNSAEAKVREILVGFSEELRELPAGEDLIDSRLIDSLTFISVVQSLIDVSGHDPDLDAVSITHLRTIAGLAEVFFGSDLPTGQASK